MTTSNAAQLVVRLRDAQSAGATGDGVTNDYTAMQAANDALGGGGIVFFTRGTYKYGTPVEMSSGVSFHGEGIDVSILSYSGASDGIHMSGTASVTKVKMGLRDLSIVGTASANSGVVLSYASYCVLFNVNVRSFLVGIQGDHGNENSFWQVFSDSNRQDGFWFSNDFNNITLVACEGVNNTRAGIYAFGCRQVAAISCAWETNAYGVYVTNNASPSYRSKGFTLLACYLEGNSTNEVLIETQGGGAPIPRGTLIEGNYFVAKTGKATTAIRVNDCDGCWIWFNTFDDAELAYTNSLVEGGGSISGLVWGPNKDTSGGISSASASTLMSVSGISVATQAQQETGSSTAAVVTSGRQQFHPSAAKGWAKFDITGTVASSYNVTSVTDTGPGDAAINWTTQFSSVNYSVVTGFEASLALIVRVKNGTQTTAVVSVQAYTSTSPALTDPTNYHVAAYGDQ